MTTSRADTIARGLNDVQKEAALHREGPLVVFAGAGSGKTRIITSRIALLIESGVKPHQIFAVTFTNKAAGEMRERALAMTPDASGAHIATFHSACARWLREFAPELGFTSDFSIYDDNDMKALVKRILKDMGIKIDGKYTTADYKSAISRVKTYGLLPHEARERAQQYKDLFPPLGADVYKKYQEMLALQNAMDFSDLMMNMLLLLRTNQKVRKILMDRYHYILVDEYQDTNPTQFELISLLVGSKQNLMVVGDDDQSIYSWRGADPSNIIDFKEHYPKARVIRLEQNYRCAANIVDAASAVIQNNQKRAVKKLWTDNPSGEPIEFHREYDGQSESWYLADHIKAEKSFFDYNDVAVFYRTNAQSRQIEETLRRNLIPYKIYGSLRFYDRAEIKDLTSYIRLVVNPKDDAAFSRVVNVPTRGIGQKAVDSLSELAETEGVSLMEMARKVATQKIPRMSVKFAAFVSLMDTLKEKIEKESLTETVSILLTETDYKTHVEKKYPEQVEDKMENIHELGAAIGSYAEEFPDRKLNRWLQDVALSGSEEQSDDGVSLMTLHSAKGLEFRRVFLLGFEDGLLPHNNSLDYDDDLEEERRLLYVGMTRAKEKLTLLAAEKRRVFNNWMANSPSRFLSEIPPELIKISGVSGGMGGEFSSQNGFDNFTVEDEQPEESVFEPSSYSVGMRVSHPTYGKGTIDSIENEFGVMKSIVSFDDFGVRKVGLTQLDALLTAGLDGGINAGNSLGKGMGSSTSDDDEESEYVYD